MNKFFFFFSILLFAIPCHARIIYVDANTPDNNDGSGWSQAYQYLQDALATISHNDEIRVAEGVYKPDETTANPDGTGDREATFGNMVGLNGIALKGGYAGYGAVDANARDVELYETVLSGDLNGDELDLGTGTAIASVDCNNAEAVYPSTLSLE